MECSTIVELYNFLILNTSAIIIDCRPLDLYIKCKLRYPLLIHLPHGKLPDKRSHTEFCEHYKVNEDSVTNKLVTDQEVLQVLQDIELLVGPYERCVLRQRNKAKVVLINTTATIPASVASFASMLLLEGKCLSVHHTAANFYDFAVTYPFMVEHTERRMSNCSVTLRPSISLELDDLQIIRHKKLLIKQYPNAILANKLYLGTRQQAMNLEMMMEMGITHIIRAHDIKEKECVALSNKFDEQYIRLDTVKYLDVAVDDKVGVEIGMFLKPCVEFYNSAWSKDGPGRVLVHCNMGISRSSTITIAILMSLENMDLKTALEYAKKCRHQVQPNYSFIKELLKLENELFGYNSLTLTELVKLNVYYSRAHAIDVKNNKPCVVM